jgi:hypothetical protein
MSRVSSPAATLEFVLKREPLASLGAACLALAWRHRGMLLA